MLAKPSVKRGSSSFVQLVEKIFQLRVLKVNVSVEKKSAKNVERSTHSVQVADGLSVSIAILRAGWTRNIITASASLQSV